jgi:uncharacterized membrane protein
MNKTIILPIISAVSLIVQTAFHIQIGSDLQNAVATLIESGFVVYGIVKNHFQPKV